MHSDFRVRASITLRKNNFDPRNRRFLVGAFLTAFAIGSGSCIVHRVEVKPVDAHDSVVVTSPVKAHLKDGSTVVYTSGITVSGGVLRGAGVRYDLSLTHSTKVDTLALDDVVGLESFETKVNEGKTAIVTTLAVGGGIAAGVALATAIFGSCPTVYSDDGSVSETELFSNSIAPLFEGRDVDRLQARPDTNGTLRLELRNEAMETHYINHLQIFEVDHSADEFVLPDAQGHPMVVRDVRTPEVIKDRIGHDLQAVLSATDNKFYRTDQSIIESATIDDMDDWIDLKLDLPQGADATTLVFRLRNSLLATTLLYDVMLGPAGARAIDWLGTGLSQISTAVELGRWHQRRAGLHVSVYRDGAFTEVVRIPNSGPIYWHDVAAVIPVQSGETSLRIRLSFLADEWRIDRVGVASEAREAVLRTIPISEVTDSAGHSKSETLDSLYSPDDRYLQTSPGQRFFASFRVGSASPGQSQTFLLSSQGYYTEWIRGTWIQTATAKEPFAPTDEALLSTLRKWVAIREAFEQRFFKNRVPVN